MQTSSRATIPALRRATPVIALLGLLAAGCAGDLGKSAEKVAADPVAPAGPVSFAAPWTHDKVAAIFLDPTTAGLTGGETYIVPKNTIDKVSLCAPLHPTKTPVIPVDKRFSTARHDTAVPGKGRIVQQGWIMPSAEAAATLMKKVDSRLGTCRYDGSAKSPLEPGDKVTGTSTPSAYPRDQYGWQGHRIEQTHNVNNTRKSVTTELLLRRGPIILRLSYSNYTPKAAEKELRGYNMATLNKVLAHTA